MENKTLPNVRVLPLKHDPVESINSWIFDAEQQEWAANISMGKSGEKCVTVKDLVNLSDQKMLVEAITSLLLENKRLKAEQ